MATFIQEAVAPATEVGLTTFSDEAHVQRAPQALNTSQDRQAFADDLPDTQSGATDITLGLTTAAKVRARLLSSVDLLTLFETDITLGLTTAAEVRTRLLSSVHLLTLFETDVTLGLTTAAKVRARLLSSVGLLTLFETDVTLGLTTAAKVRARLLSPVD